MAQDTKAIAPWRRGLRRLAVEAGGATAVEFAIVAPILIALTFGAIDGGRAMLAFNSVEKLAKEGARFASVRGSEYSSPATENDVSDFVKDRATGLNGAKVGVNVTWAPDNDPGSVVAVQVTYTFDAVFLRFATLNLDRSSTLNIMR